MLGCNLRCGIGDQSQSRFSARAVVISNHHLGSGAEVHELGWNRSVHVLQRGGSDHILRAVLYVGLRWQISGQSRQIAGIAGWQGKTSSISRNSAADMAESL